MKKRIVNVTYPIICILISLAAIALMIIYCMADGIKGDEIFTMGFANNSDGYMFMTRGVIDRYSDNGWMSGDAIRDYYAVDEGEKFDFMIAHRNARDDVHPPAYFMLLNAVSSFFVGQATTIPGHIINVVMGIIMCMTVYLISLHLIGDKWGALVPVAALLCTNGFEDIVTYIRMYSAFCALTLIYMYLCILLVDKKEKILFLCILTGIVTCMGVLTHYYYYIMCASVTLTTVILLLIQKRYKHMVGYLISLLVGWAIAFFAYPYVFRHLLFSDRGEQALDNLSANDPGFYLDHLTGFSETLNTEIFNDKATIAIAVLVIIYLIYGSVRLLHIKDRADLKPSDTVKWDKEALILTAVPSIIYFAVLFKISYSYRWLYISPVFAPLLTVLCFAAIYGIRGAFGQKGCMIALTLVTGLLFIHAYAVIPNRYMEYSALNNRYDISREYGRGRDCLYIYDEWNDPHNGRDLELMNYDKVCFISAKEVKGHRLDDVMAYSDNRQNGLVVYIKNTIEDREDIVDDIRMRIGGTDTKLLLTDDYSVYMIDV